jgi:hypothetical protein
MSPSIFALISFLVGTAFGYAIRAIIFWRRHDKARRRYETTGSYQRLE